MYTIGHFDVAKKDNILDLFVCLNQHLKKNQISLSNLKSGSIPSKQRF